MYQCILFIGLGRSVPAAGGSAQKRPHGEISNTDSKKKCDWYGLYTNFHRYVICTTYKLLYYQN